MVIILIDGGVIIPEGRAEADAFGIRIEMGNSKHIIPHGQIRWIYENTDPKMEQIFANSVSNKKTVAPFAPYRARTNDELVKGLYQ